MKGIRFNTNDKFVVDKSNISGRGTIASQNIKSGELIGTAVDNENMIRGKAGMMCDTRTRLGRMVNHQEKENATQKSENNMLNLYAKNNIKEGEEITLNYKNSPDYVDKNTEGYK